MANHEDVGCSEYQSRLSKGLTAKVVQSLELEARFWAPKTQKATAMVALVSLPSVTVTVTVTVSISRIANKMDTTGRFLSAIPNVGVTSPQNARGIVSAARHATDEKPTYQENRGRIALERQPGTGIAFGQREGRIRFADRVEAHL